MAALLTGTRRLDVTRAEITALADRVHLDEASASRTYRVERDTEGVLWLIEPGGKLYRLSLERSHV